MNLLLRAAAAAALLLPLAVAPATAQDYRGAWTLYGGGIWFSDLNNNGDITGVVVDDDGLIIIDDGIVAGTGDLTLQPGWIVGTQLEYWFGNGRFGLRGNLGYTERPFQLDFDNVLFDPFIFGFANEVTFGDVNVWFLDGDLMVRILSPDRNRTWAPFVTLGAGAAIYNPAGNASIVLPAANVVFGDADVIFDEINGDTTVLIVAGTGNSETRFQTPIGIGTDILPGWTLGNFGLGLRLEVVDHIVWESPADPLFGTDDFDPVHNVRFTAGLLTTFGRLFPEEVVAVAPPPAPPAPPAEETIAVCVIDPNTYEVGYINAIFVPSTRDTLVALNGQRAPLSTVFPETAPLYVANAPWYTAGQPLTVTVQGMESEWVTFGGARVIEPADLVFLGTVRGTPVYASAADAAPIRADLEAARAEPDLARRLEMTAAARQAFENIDVVYVPLEIGCVFQALRRVEEVRKVRG